MIGQCSRSALEAALAGRLSTDEQSALNRHLEECEACASALEDLAGGAAWHSEAASLLAADELDSDVPCRHEWSEIDFTVDHLEPCDEPNVLGKLGDYEVLEVIGRGGMGIVLKGHDRALKRCVAIKVLSPHLAQSSLARKRFAREAQAAAAVVHANVLAIHQVQGAGRLPYLVMPLVAGESLAQRLAKQGTLDLVEILRIGAQAAAGLAAAHDQGLVHRDVKPANILLEKGVERAVLTDFGLARAADDATLTRWGVIAGTPQYMSPEQAKGEAVDGRSDLFSLGSVLYEMATGVAPFTADSTVATLRKLIDEPPRAIASLNPTLPPWFVAIVERLLEKDRARRFDSAAEVSRLLEGCLAHVQQPAVTPLPAGLPVAKTARAARRRHAGWLAAIAILLVGVGIVAAVMAAWSPPDIAGNWHESNWGQIELTRVGEGEYRGTYSSTTAGSGSGEIELHWSRLSRQYQGQWREGQRRFGELNVSLLGDAIVGQYDVDPKSKTDPGNPAVSQLVWTRAHAAYEISIPAMGKKVEALDFHNAPLDDWITNKLSANAAPPDGTKRQQFEPREGMARDTSWAFISTRSATERNAWGVMAQMTIGGVARIMLPEDQEHSSVSLKLLGGDNDAIQLELQDRNLEPAMVVTLKRDALVNVTVNGELYGLCYSTMAVTADQPDVSPFAPVFIRWSERTRPASTPREVVEVFIARLLTGNIDQANTFMNNGGRRDDFREVTQLFSKNKITAIKVGEVLVNSNRSKAIVRTDKVTVIESDSHELRDLYFTFDLENVDGNWLIRDVNVGSEAKSQARLNRFLQDGEDQPTSQSEAPQKQAESRTSTPEGASPAPSGASPPTDPFEPTIKIDVEEQVYDPARRNPVSAPSATYNERAPYTATRWHSSDNGQGKTYWTLEVMYSDVWEELLEIDGIPVSKLVAYAQEHHPVGWSSYFDEHFVQLLSEFGHPPGDRVRLKFNNREEPGTFEYRAEMTQENRKKILQSRRKSPTDAHESARTRAQRPGANQEMLLGERDRLAARVDRLTKLAIEEKVTTEQLREAQDELARKKAELTGDWQGYYQRRLERAESEFARALALSEQGQIGADELEKRSSEIFHLKVTLSEFRPARRIKRSVATDQPPTSHVPFEVGATQLQDGDRITIDDIRGTTDKFEVGGTYVIRGTYRLASRDKAILHAYCTIDASEKDVPLPRPEDSVTLERGEGSFVIRQDIVQQGKPHLSFYSAEEGESFASVYFGTGEWLLKRGSWEKKEQPATNDAK